MRFLHSFPTRRSSDLPRDVWRESRKHGAVTPRVVADYDAPVTPPERDAMTDILNRILARKAEEVAERRSKRSEEHTTELPSPVHLVIRRLRDNKKYRT